MAILEREVFETSRAAEYFSVKELQAQTGQPTEMFAAVSVKELVDNGMDAAEAAGKSPVIRIEVAQDGGLLRLSVRDNGGGLPPAVLEKILNFQTRTSDKAAYRTPTRGAQGNALKTILGIPFAMGGAEPVLIEACGIQHSVRCWTDPAGELRIDHQTARIAETEGTRVSLAIPLDGRGQRFDPEYWAEAFAIFNPHAQVHLQIPDFERNSLEINLAKFPGEKTQNSGFGIRPATDLSGWRKFMPADLPSAWWFSDADIKRLVFSHIAACRNGKETPTVAAFVKGFRGLSRKAGTVCAAVPGVERVSDFEHRPELVSVLLSAMRDAAEPPKSEVLGQVGEDHLRRRFAEAFTVEKHWYKKVSGVAGDVPFVFEAILARVEKSGLHVYTGINFSPTYSDPFVGTVLSAPEEEAKNWPLYGLRGYLSYCHVRENSGGFAVAIHLSCPALDFLDRGKTRLAVPEEMAVEISRALWAVCRETHRDAKRRERDAAKAERQSAAAKRPSYTMRDVVFTVLPEALDRATGGGQYPVSARSLFYQVRPLAQLYTDKPLDYGYFSQEILTQYQEECGPIPGLYYDPRGVLYEPHTGNSVALGTREVEAYSLPPHTFNKILYVEKKGLYPVLQAAKLAERWDMAVVAAEGYATQAARVLFQQAEGECQLFVLHDADPSGYEIARTLREETRRMPGYSVSVFDLGLRVEDALGMGLEPEEFTRQKALPAPLLDVLTEAERAFFMGRQVGSKAWIAQRVELNAMSAPQLIGYIEDRLQSAGAAGKVLPPESAVADYVREVIFDAAQTAVVGELSRILDLPGVVNALADSTVQRISTGKLHKSLGARLETLPEQSWREIASDLAGGVDGRLVREVLRSVLAGTPK